MSLSVAGHVAVTPPLQTQPGFKQSNGLQCMSLHELMILWNIFRSQLPGSIYATIDSIPLCCVAVCKLSLGVLSGCAKKEDNFPAL